MNKQKLIIEQLDKKLLEFDKLKKVVIPPEGWIFSIRTALGMSLRQLGKRLNITAQSVKELETREKNWAVSIKILRQAGLALDMKFVYGFIPKNKTLEKMIEEKAIKLAQEIVLRTSVNMRLEGQENDPERLKNAIEDRAREIKQEIPKYLWD